MYKLIILCCIVLFTHSLSAAPNIEHWKTKNGMKVYFVSAPELPMLDIRVTFSAGSARDGDAPGLARLVSAMLLQGADGMNADQIAQSFENIGAIYSSGSLRDMAWISLRTLSDSQYQKPALEMFSKVLWKPDFPKTDFKRIKNQTLVGLKAAEAKPSVIANKAFFKALYGDHPYGSPTSGSTESVNAIKRKQLKPFFDQYYVAKNGLIALTGALDRKTAKKLAEKLSSGLKEGQPASKIPAVKPLEKSETISIPFPSKQAHVLIGSPGIWRGHEDYYSLYLANHPLGGSGLTSRLSKKIRDERGFVYSIYSYFSPMASAGPYLIGLQTRGSQAKEAIELVQTEIGKYLKSGPTEEELTASRRNITGGYPLRIASNSDIVQYLAVIGFYDLPLDYLDTFTEIIDAIKHTELVKAYQKHIDPDKFVTVIVGGEG